VVGEIETEMAAGAGEVKVICAGADLVLSAIEVAVKVTLEELATVLDANYKA
jgi:hypothetical protein